MFSILNLKGIIRLFFPKMPPSDKVWKEWRSQRNKQLVCHYASGNIRLQMGQYVTEAELKSKKNSVLGYRF